MEFGADTLGTEVAHCVLTEVKEVFSPDTDPSLAVLGTIARFNTINSRCVKESEGNRTI